MSTEVGCGLILTELDMSVTIFTAKYDYQVMLPNIKIVLVKINILLIPKWIKKILP